MVLACCTIPAGLLAAPQTDGDRTGWFDRELRRFRSYPHLDRAHRLIDAGRLEEARAELEEGLRIDPAMRATRRAYVVLLHRLGDHAAVVEQAGLLLSDDPGSSVAWLYRGLARQALGQSAAALEDLRMASTLPDLSEAERRVTLATLADLAVRLGRPAEAMAFLEQLPRSRWAYGEHALHGAALARVGRLPEAASAYLDAAAVAPSSGERSSALRERMGVLAQLGDLVGAREAARSALELAPDDTRLLVALGDYASRLNENAEAVEWLKQALASPGLTSPDERARLLLSLGYAYRRLEDASKAEGAFLAAAGLGGGLRSRALIEAAEVGLKEGDAEGALRHLEDAAAVTTDGAALVGLYERQGFLQQSLGRLDEARAAFEKALALAPRRPGLHRALGQLLLASGRGAEAVESFERSLALEDNPEDWYDLALAQAASGRTDDALESFRRALEESPDHPERQEEILLQMAQLEADRGRDPEAAALFLEAFTRRSSVAALVGAAESYAKARRWPEAADANLRLLDLEDLPPAARADSWTRLGYSRVGAGELEAAAEAFANAIASGKDDEQTHRELGLLLYRLGRFAEATPQFRRSHELRPDPLDLVYLGRCEKARGRAGLAILYYEDAAAGGQELEPETRRSVVEELGYLYAQVHDYERAARSFEASLAMGPNAAIESRLGRMQRLLGRVEEARRTLETIPIDSLPPQEAAVVLDELAEIYEAGQDLAAASAARAQSRALAPSAERDYRLGLLQQNGGNLAGAIELLEAAVAADSTRLSYRVALAYACERAGRPTDAARLFEEVVARAPDYPGLYEELAYNRMREARNEEAARWFERAIDDASLPLASADGLQTRTTYRLRREVAKLENDWDVSSYLALASGALPGVSEGFGGILADSQGGMELAFRPPGIGLRSDRVFQVFGRLLGANFSWTDPAGPSAYQAGLGVRYKPFGRQNLYLWVERLFGLSEAARDSWLMRGLFSWDRGYEMRPARPRWPYSYVLADVARFSGDGGTLLYGEARQGMSWNFGDRLLLTPHVLAEGRRRVSAQTDGTLAVGAGASVRWLFNDDRYHAYRSSLELRAYFKLGRSWTAEEASNQSGFLIVASVGF